MKKHTIILAFVFALPVLTFACDICGCGVGNSYIGILPEFNKKVFGLRYRYNSLLTHVGVNGATTYLTTTEQYKTVELWSGWNIGKHFRLMAAIPYAFNQRNNQGAISSKNGLGDISFNSYYELVNSRKTVYKTRLLVQSFWIGGGIKLPTGQYNPADKSGINQNANLFQLGTASTDFMLNAIYDLRLQDAGINTTASYKMNNENSARYAYGNKLNLSAQLYYKFNINQQVTIAPNTGVQYEKAATDNDNDFAVDVSGGNLLLATVGVETKYKKIAAGANWQSPLSQNLGRGFIKANNKMMVHISFSL